MRYHNITTDDMLNGDGLRVVLWLAGCEHYCPGCQNPVTWNPDDGLLFDDAARDEICRELEKDYISGLTLSGGDPLYSANRRELTDFLRFISEKFPGKKIWCYTGYGFEDVMHEPPMYYIDVLVDGPFVQELADVTYPWAGSTNQRVIDVKESLKQGKTILYSGGER